MGPHEVAYSSYGAGRDSNTIAEPLLRRSCFFAPWFTSGKAEPRAQPRYHTPSVALMVQLGLSTIQLLFAESFRQLFSPAIFSEWLFYDLGEHRVCVAAE